MMGAVGEGVVVTCQPCYARVFLSNAVAERRFRRSPGPRVAQPLSRQGTDRVGDAVLHVPSQTLESPGSGRGFRQRGAAWVTTVRDESGIQGVLVSLSQNGYAMALMVAMTTDPVYRPFSLGKHLFDAGIAEAVRRGCRG